MDNFLAGMFNWVIETIFALTGATASQLEITQTSINFVAEIWDYFILLGLGLTVVYFIIDLNKKWMFEGQNLSLKTMMLPFFKLIIAVIVMANAGWLFGALCSFSNGFARFLEGLSIGNSLTPNVNDVGGTMIKQFGFWEKIIMLFPLIIGFAVSVVCNLVWAYKALVYKIELVVRVAFAPVALADVYSGMNASAIKFIKGTLALILYGGCLIIIPKLTLAVGADNFLNMMDEISTTVASADFVTKTSNVFNVILSWIGLIICPIAGIGLTGAAKTITKEALGA
jgi:hypothetical protein